jgi:hypothetical protein
MSRNTQPDNNGPKKTPQETPPCIHDDEDLQQQQQEFDKANAAMDPGELAEALKRLMERSHPSS